MAIGIQLYTFGDGARKDLAGTLRTIAAIGYREVETSFLVPAETLAAELAHAGLRCPSVHVPPNAWAPGPSLEGDLAALAADAQRVGAAFVVCSLFPIASLAELRPRDGESGAQALARVGHSYTREQWLRHADFLNEKGAVLAKAGVQLAYHNHNVEFARVGDSTGFDLLLEGTDPALVKVELDVGWAAAAGRDPSALLRTHAGRIRLLHLKDLKGSTQPNTKLRMDPTEVGAGIVDWHRLLRAAREIGVLHGFVEQEPPFERPEAEAARRSFEFLRSLGPEIPWGLS
jgi:sugar phosphate isomerase/epimerase